MNVAHKIDIHCEFELIQRQIADRASITNGCVVYQYVDGAMLTHDLTPNLLNLARKCKVDFVEVNVGKSGHFQSF
ncbi:MAG: hypothetical protein ACKO96_18865 [Flammeovirgaceae bacterium]